MFITDLVVSFGLLLAICTSASAQGWRGIVPLRSDCETVKRSLGIPQCRTGTYHLPDGSISISFSDGTCDSGWNVPDGTVISFYVHTNTKQKLQEKFSDLSKYAKSHEGDARGAIRYTNPDEGMSITATEDGTILSIFYGPTTKDSSLRCPSTGNDVPQLPLASYKFDEFGVLPIKEEKTRLDNFAFELNAQRDLRAYIVAYPGPQGRADALARSARIRAYLVKCGISKSRVFAISGGLRKESIIQLYLVMKRTD